MGAFLCHSGLGLDEVWLYMTTNKQTTTTKTDNSSLDKRVPYFSLRLGSQSVEDCLAIPQFQESEVLLTVALSSAAPGFHLMVQDVCLSSCHHFNILANKKEEQRGRT